MKRVLDILKPSPVDYSASTPMVWSTAKEFEGKADKKEKWYKTPYQASQVFFSALSISVIFNHVQYISVNLFVRLVFCQG